MSPVEVAYGAQKRFVDSGRGGQTGMDDPIRILIVDDDTSLRCLIGDFLKSHGYLTFEADGGQSMRSLLATEAIDVVVLDIMMPGEDGLTLARSISGRSGLAIVMISALGSETDRIIGLEVGADDYLPKPVSPRELLARIRAVLRRQRVPGAAAEETRPFRFEGWGFDPVKRILRDPANVIISLSEGEFSLLQVFIERPQRVLSRDQLLEYSRGPDSDAFDRAVDTQVSRLRRKLATRGSGELIRTIRSEGYMFMPAVQRR